MVLLIIDWDACTTYAEFLSSHWSCQGQPRLIHGIPFWYVPQQRHCDEDNIDANYSILQKLPQLLYQCRWQLVRINWSFFCACSYLGWHSRLPTTNNQVHGLICLQNIMQGRINAIKLIDLYSWTGPKTVDCPKNIFSHFCPCVLDDVAAACGRWVESPRKVTISTHATARFNNFTIFITL